METLTVRELLDRTRRFLAERGHPSAALDAQVLLAHVLGVDRMHLFMAADRPVSDEETTRYRELVRRRARNEPVAYLVGHRGFWTLDLKVDARVLIPRPETERIVEAVLDFVDDDRDRAWRVVDVGTGSGALALALASELPAATVVAIDVSADAIEVATANADAVGVRSRVHFLRGHLLDALVRKGSRADIIVSNPPYIGEPERESLSRDVRDFEPALALFSGQDGLGLIRELLPQAAQVLEPGGLFVMEFGAGQHDAIAALARPHFAHVAVVRDLAGIQRALLASETVDVGAIARSLEASMEPPTSGPPPSANRSAALAAAAAPNQAAALPTDGSLDDQRRAAAWHQVREENLPVIDLDKL